MKKLSELLEEGATPTEADVEIEDVVFDSRQVKPGALFVALRGTKQDGRHFIPSAVASGARAVVVDADVSAASVPIIRVPDALRSLASISNRFWNFPSRRLFMVGITGTNGKTTTSFLVEHLLEQAGWPTAVLGTINYRFKNSVTPAPNTTPFANDLQRFLARVADGSGTACVMEVSSHSLALGRVEGVEFDVAVFTNLTQDHLDFHQTMEHYLQSKAKLFSGLTPASTKKFVKRAILNADDPASKQLAADCRVPVWTYSAKAPADIFATGIRSDALGSHFELHAPGNVVLPIQFPLLGHYNIMNALAAAAVAFSQGVSPDVVQKALRTAPGVPGRMEQVKAGQNFTVVVDYAHTDDALRQVMSALRALGKGRLITVFGCGGDRDRTKRPLMGQAAAELSDEVIVTSDNPRSEDPQRITLDIEVGVRRVRSDRYTIIVDRETAIARAFERAQPGDIVLIAGKGHENYQILKDRTIPFDDRDVARRLLEQRAAS